MKANTALLTLVGIFCLFPLIGGLASATEILTNGGFETGSLPPWVWGRTQFAAHPSNTANEWFVTTTNPFDGAFSAEVNDNFELVQDFAPVPVADISNISFAAWTSPRVEMAVVLFYSGGAEEPILVPTTGGSWRTVNITSSLDDTQTDLIGISFFGSQYSGVNPGNAIYLDDVSITSGVVPEPSTWTMMLLGFAGLGFAGYRVRKGRLLSLVAFLVSWQTRVPAQAPPVSDPRRRRCGN